jgi:hypothetical protein
VTKYSVVPHPSMVKYSHSHSTNAGDYMSQGRPTNASDRILLAVADFHYNISSLQAFPDSEMEHEMLAHAWKEACIHMHITEPLMTPHIAKLVSDMPIILHSIETVVFFSLDHQSWLTSLWGAQDQDKAPC